MSVTKLCSFFIFVLMSVLQAKPNVILIMSDDVGYGDIAAHGNQMIKTPRLDKMRAESARFERFFVSPTCSPTRAAVMTGRWPFETGVNHTIAGRSILRKGLPTVADAFQKAGYRTGLFGKWHLGDFMPALPEHRGFSEVLIHKGGGIGQSPDYWGNSYIDPTLWRNGSWEKHQGFCTEIFVREGLKWAKSNDEPYFLYIPFNVAHTPWTVKPEWEKKLLDRGVDKELVKFYALVEDMDTQIGKVLDEVDLEKTIVIFMSDNGTAGAGYNAGMKGRKGSPDEGGVRVPFWVSWRGKVSPKMSHSRVSGHIDLFPTLCGLTGVKIPEDAELDGFDWSGWLLGKSELPKDRLWMTNLGRWDGRSNASMARLRNFAVRSEQHRLVGPKLYDMKKDPNQKTDIVSEHAKLVPPLMKSYNEWWSEQRLHIHKPVRIEIGHEKEEVTELCAHDWYPSDLKPEVDSAEGIWDQWQIRDYLTDLNAGKKGLKELRGKWMIDILRDGRYRFTLRKLPQEALDGPDTELAEISRGTGNLLVGQASAKATLKGPVKQVAAELDLYAGEVSLEAWWGGQFADAPEKTLGCFFVTVERIGDRKYKK